MTARSRSPKRCSPIWAARRSSAIMADGPIDLARCRILISNDDGIESPGIKVLKRIARELSGARSPDSPQYSTECPAVPPAEAAGFAITSQGKRAIADNLTDGVDPRGRPYYWIGPVRDGGAAEPGTDVAALAGNRVSITPI